MPAASKISVSFAPGLLQISDELETARALIEKRFTNAGAHLESVLQVIEELMGSLEKLSAVIGPEAVGRAKTDLLAAVSQLRALPASYEQRQSRLQALLEASAAATVHVAAMAQVMRYLRVFALNVKVTAASNAQSAKVFDGFAEEMFGQIAVGANELDAFRSMLEVLENDLRVALESEQALQDRGQLLLMSVPDRLCADAEAISGNHTQVERLIRDVSQLGRDLQMKLASALAALQIGDITRQRLEHVQAALSDVQAACDITPEVGVERAILPMLAEQLTETSDNFSRENARAAKNFDLLAAGAREMASLRGLGGGQDNGSLRSLEGSVGQAMQLIHEVEAAAAEADRLGVSTRDTVETLVQGVGALNRVKEEIQRMAINMGLRCSRLGEVGKPLNVIARELTVCAERLEGSAEDSLRAFDDLRSVAESLKTGSADGRIDLASMLENVVVTLREAADVIETDLTLARRQAMRVAESLEQGVGGLKRQDDLGDVLKKGAEDLEASACGGPTHPSAALLIDDLMEKISGRYTMAAERAIHARHLGAAERSQAAEAEEDLFADALF